jgi:hypothetical protein
LSLAFVHSPFCTYFTVFGSVRYHEIRMGGSA